MTDLISRQAAIEAMTADNLNRNLDSVHDDDMKRAARAARRALAMLPAAQRWIPEIEALAGTPADVIAIALIYARHMVNDGVDVCEKWETATQQQAAFDAAYRCGRYDEWKRWAGKEEP